MASDEPIQESFSVEGPVSQADDGDANSSTCSGESLAEMDRQQRELELEKTLFSCAFCRAGVNGHEGKTDQRIDLRLLSCLHSVCRNCITSSCIRDDGKAVCPSRSCLEPTHLPPIGWVDALPRNYWFLRKVESQAKPEKTEIECGECAEGEPVEQIVGVCLDCDEPLCDFHWLAHQKRRRTKGHKLSKGVEGLSKMPSNGAASAQLQSTGVPCAIHVDHNVNGFCKTCGEMVCKVCQERTHRQHEIDPDFQMESICAQRRDLERDMEMSSSGLDTCEALIAKLKACINDVNLQAEEASKDVTASVQRLVDDLREEEKLTLRHIDEARWSLQKELDERLERTKAAKHQLERARYLTRASLFAFGDVNNAQLHHVGNLLHRNLNEGQRECVSQLDFSDLPSLDIVQKRGCKFTTEVRSFNAKLRSNHVLTAEPADDRCSFELKEHGEYCPAIHQSSWRHVSEMRRDNAPLKSRGEVCAVIESPLGEIEPCTISACTCIEEDDSGDGQFDVHFDMKVPGEHKLHVTQNGRTFTAVRARSASKGPRWELGFTTTRAQLERSATCLSH